MRVEDRPDQRVAGTREADKLNECIDRMKSTGVLHGARHASGREFPQRNGLMCARTSPLEYGHVVCFGEEIQHGQWREPLRD